MANDAKTLLEMTQQVVTIGAIVVGGIGGYIKFLHGRVHFTRLDANFKTSFYRKNGTDFLLVALTIKNTGSLNAHLCRGAHYLIVSSCDPIPNADTFEGAHFEEVSVFKIFEAEEHLEQSESIYEEKLIAFPVDKYLALSLTMEVRAKKSPWMFWLPKRGVIKSEHLWCYQKIVYPPRRR
jgi:hypothetical protein